MISENYDIGGGDSIIVNLMYDDLEPRSIEGALKDKIGR